MPGITALPPSNSHRVWLDYNDGIHDHSMMLRYDGSVSDASAVVPVFADFLVAIEPQIYLLSIIGVRKANAGSDVTNPITWTGDGSYGTGTMPTVDAPKELSFTGKSPDGHRWRASIFGCKTTIPGTWKFIQGASADLDAARAVLGQAFTDGIICTISKGEAILNLTMPIGQNDHFIVKNRGG